MRVFHYMVQRTVSMLNALVIADLVTEHARLDVYACMCGSRVAVDSLFMLTQ